MQDNHSFFSSVATMQCNTSRFLLLPGNVIPHYWYKSFRVKGCADFTAITILADVVAWWRNTEKIISSKDLKSPDFNGESLSISYEYLSEKFGFNKETARRAFVRLEKAQTLTRQVKNVKSENGSYINRLYIILNQTFYQSCFRSPEYDIRALPRNQASSNGEAQKDSMPNDEKLPSPLKCGDHISNKTESFKNRSNESNLVKVKSNLEEGKGEDAIGTQFLKTVKPEELNQTVTSQVPASSVFDKIKAKFIGKKRQSIAELAAITEEETYALRTSSGRAFSLDYINKLKERLGTKYPGHGFYTRTLFLVYLQKVLTNELRKESVVNSEGFKFKANDDENRMQNYLRTVEESRGTSKQSQVRKKIAACFETNIAYRLLTSWTYNNEIHNNNFLLRTSEPVNLSANQEATVLDLIKSVYGNQVDKVKFIASIKPEGSQPVVNLALNLGKEGSLWNKVSSKLLDYHGEAIHKSWFSKLQAIENENLRVITLKAPTDFIKDWIITHYKVVIEGFCKEENCNLDEVLV